MRRSRTLAGRPRDADKSSPLKATIHLDRVVKASCFRAVGMDHRQATKKLLFLEAPSRSALWH